MWVLCSKSYLWKINCNTKCYNQIKKVYCIHKILIIIVLALFFFSAETKKPKAEVKSEFKCEGKNIVKKWVLVKKQCLFSLPLSILDIILSDWHEISNSPIPCETICR